jgi:hypothetical protein
MGELSAEQGSGIAVTRGYRSAALGSDYPDVRGNASDLNKTAPCRLPNSAQSSYRPKPKGYPAYLSDRGNRQYMQGPRPRLPERGGSSMLRLSPGRQRRGHRRAPFSGHRNHSRTRVVIAGPNLHPAPGLDQRQISRQRRALDPKPVGKITDRHGPAQYQHHKDRELRYTDAVRPQPSVECPRDGARAPTRRQAEAGLTLG